MLPHMPNAKRAAGKENKMFQPKRLNEEVYLFVAEETAFTLDITLTKGRVLGIINYGHGLFTYQIETKAGFVCRLAADLWESPEAVAASVKDLIA